MTTTISAVFNAHPEYIEQMYLNWKQDPNSVEGDWAAFFQGFDFAQQNAAPVQADAGGSTAAGTALDSNQLAKEIAVIGLIHGYRDRGHMLSTTNPIRERKDRAPKLELSDYGLTSADLQTTFFAGSEIGMPGAKLADIVTRLQAIYCGNIGFETTQIHDKEKRMWLRERVERVVRDNSYGFSKEKKHRILSKLNEATLFEQFLHTKYVGQKRFSLEGGESCIPALDAMIQAGSELGTMPVEEVVIGMAHRGRLNVLANVLRKTYEQIFAEFEGKAVADSSQGSGDVKYHMGFSSQVKTLNGREVYLKLLPNPSHLEAVDPVVHGFARAKADALYAEEYDRILPILVHGDAAVAGQGIVYEILQMSKLPGYQVGGTIHLVINNQVGFTTDFEDARSSTYCTSVANVVQAPVFHVNGDDTSAVVFAAELAVEYRQKFNSDVFIDMVCYRKYGHNESDEPRFTQPEMQKRIDAHKTPREVFTEFLLQRGDIDTATAQKMEAEFKAALQSQLDNVRGEKELPYKYQETEIAWKAIDRSNGSADFQKSPETGIPKAVINKLLKHLTTFPEGFKPISQLDKLMKAKAEMVANGEVDWSLGELMAYGSVLIEGADVRISGQDVKRGTFSHRHAVAIDSETFLPLNRLEGLSEKQGQMRIFNSLLSEYAVLGFEYGYTLASPHNLVIWEAQFGDFANGASTIIDQFILAGESKWKRRSGLVMLLPHGYEGQGPEHSSARLERFLQGCAEENIIVANVTTSANLFHLMRRQVRWEFRKPCVVMSPKSILRAPYCVSKIEDFVTGTRFQEMYDDATADAKKVKRVVVCSGKLYYDLLKQKEASKDEKIALVRLEQMYPFPTTQMDAIVKKYGKAELVWAQEEPANMGAWSYICSTQSQYGWRYVGRKAAASPATGYLKVHNKEQDSIVQTCFEI
jgi:2-oxoglutarate dehydrogenase E1 component